jgi:hypothetical protein
VLGPICDTLTQHRIQNAVKKEFVLNNLKKNLKPLTFIAEYVCLCIILGINPEQIKFTVRKLAPSERLPAEKMAGF